MACMTGVDREGSRDPQTERHCVSITKLDAGQELTVDAWPVWFVHAYS